MRSVLGLLAALITGQVAGAQTVRFRADVVAMTYQEASEGRDGKGSGAGFGAEFRYKRWRLDSRVFIVKLSPDGDQAPPAFDAAQVDIRLAFAVTPFLEIEAGGGRRFIDPDFVAQEVGLGRIGLYSENRVSRIASLWIRGAYLIEPQFTGGGSSDLAFELGVGIGVGTPNGRFRVHSEYEFQRIDRDVNGSGVPIQTSLARFGIALGF